MKGLPRVPYRQWVLTFPWAVRFHVATDPALFSEMLGAFLRIVFAWQRRRARALGIPRGLTGSASFHQRFGGALNCNPHVHAVLPDGVFVEGEGALSFAPLPPPEQENVERLAGRIAVRLGSIVRKRIGDDDRLAPDDDAAMFAAAAESLRLSGIRPREDEADSRRLCASDDRASTLCRPLHQ